MSESTRPFFRVEVKGDLAIAGYFLMANWPNPDTAPTLETSVGPLTLCFSAEPSVIRDLRNSLSRVCKYGGLLGKSAELWLTKVDDIASRAASLPSDASSSQLNAG